MITIQIPPNYEAERRYIISTLFREFLGLDIQVEVSDRQDTRIAMDGDGQLIVVDRLFMTPPQDWLKPASLPQQPLKVWNLDRTNLSPTVVNSQIPVIYGDNPRNPHFFRQEEEQIYLGLDLFGSTFFMLSRYEEAVKPERDGHNRFPATASLAYGEGFLDRPIVNEYLEILWACLQQLWPRLERQPRQFKTYLSHDVDEPFRYAFSSLFSLVKLCGGDILKRLNPLQAIHNASGWFQVKTGHPEADPYNTFDWILEISERHNLRSAFYFISDRSAGAIDGNYTMEHPLIRDLLRKIHQRGHEIGLHTSYNTYLDPVQTKKEFDILKKTCAAEGIQQESWGGRQHFLRWQTPTTFQNWEDAGLDYDSTLCFADVAGFRCGICYEFPTFNVKTRQPLRLKERPLIVMECTVIDKRYMNLGLEGDVALQAMAKYKQRCRLFQGDFTLLWHNSRLVDKREAELYEELVSLSAPPIKLYR